MLTVVNLLAVITFQVSGWEIFSNTRFEWQYVEKLGLQAEIPIFDDKIKALEGKEITITGYFLPIDIDGNRIIISKLPYASCFFCGGGVGLESVAEVQFEKKQPPFDMDELLTVKGRLKLNKDEYGHLVFILTHSSVN